MASPTLIFKRKECERGTKFLFRKTVDEVITVGIDYKAWLPDGVEIDLLTATCVDLFSGSDVTGTVVAGTSIEADVDALDTMATVTLQAGQHTRAYRLSLEVSLNDSENQTDNPILEFRVRNPLV